MYSCRHTLSRWLLYLFCCLSASLLVHSPVAAKKKPRFIHRTPSNPKPGRSLTLKGMIIHAGELDYARFRFRKIGSKTSYKTIRLKQKGPTFFVTIPGRYLVAPGIEYYVIGTMFNGRARLLAGGLGNPLQIIVIGGADEIIKRRPKPRDLTGGTDAPDGRDTGDNTSKARSRKRGAGERLSRALRVHAASRLEQSIIKAPATTSVITAQDIKNQGWRSLLGVLRNAGGLDINRGGLAPDIGMRGSNHLGTGGRNMLFLLDGHDMSFRQMQVNFLSPAWISVDDIARIEIVRGSLSGLWGPNAFQGVVQIITKTGKEMQGYSATLGVSPLSGTHFFTVRGGDHFKSGLSIYTTLSMNHNFRSPVLAPVFEFTRLENPIVYTPENDRLLGQNFYFKLDYKGLFFTVHQSRHDATSPINRYSLLGGSDTRLIMDRIITRAGWQGKLGKSAGMRVWASFDRTTIHPDSRVTFNGFSSTPGNAPHGNSSLMLLNGTQYAPQCNTIQNANGLCVRILTVQYNQGGNNKTERACVLAKKADNDKAKEPHPQQFADKNKTWFSYPANCRVASAGSRFQRKLQAEDNRFQLGLQLNAKIAKIIQVIGGVEFEYLSSMLWNFPSLWNERINNSHDPEKKEPRYGNFRIGAFVQAQAQLGKWALLHGSARFDYDQRVGSAFSPQGGIVITPGFGLFAKAQYSLGFRFPSLYEMFAIEDNRYGNPELFNETMHSINIQLGWMRKKLLFVALNGYFNLHNDPIRTIRRAKGDALAGTAGDYQFEYPYKQPTGQYAQRINRSKGITTLGGELEARLFPIQGFELIGHFGLSIATEEIDDQGTVDRVPYSAGLYGGLSASYRYKMFRISLGVLYVGTKIVPNTAFGMAGNLPARNIQDATQAQKVPSWSADKNPRAPTLDDIPRADGYFKLHLTLQLLRIAKHLDIAVRAQNITGLAMPAYDASNPLLVPHKGFELLTWIQYNY